jgi:ankyrin repeat protein
MTPLCTAAAYGHYELAEYLITEAKANVCGKDKFKRNPLILAIMNGHMKLASLLLQYGAEWEGTDSSNNTPLHYAAGYGYRQAIDMLLKYGANINAENSWKCTPINIAILKNHIGVVKRLLEEKGVNVNGKDEEGRTIISLSLLNITETTEEFVEFLIKEKGGDPNIEDVNGFTPLHHLCSIDLFK